MFIRYLFICFALCYTPVTREAECLDVSQAVLGSLCHCGGVIALLIFVQRSIKTVVRSPIQLRVNQGELSAVHELLSRLCDVDVELDVVVGYAWTCGAKGLSLQVPPTATRTAFMRRQKT